MSIKTYQPKKATVQRIWHKLDAQGQVLGRIATQAAQLLIGKGKVTYSPHVDGGDIVVVINAAGVTVKGNSKPQQKMDFRHSGYIGGTTFTPYDRLLKERPDRAVQLAVHGMLPKNKLRARMMTRLKIYKSESHPHGAQFAPPKSETETKNTPEKKDEKAQ